MPANKSQSKMIYDPSLPEWLCLINKGYEYDVKIEWTPKGYWMKEVSKCDGLCIKDDLPFRMVGITKVEILSLIALDNIDSITRETVREAIILYDTIPVPKEGSK